MLSEEVIYDVIGTIYGTVEPGKPCFKISL